LPVKILHLEDDLSLRDTFKDLLEIVVPDCDLVQFANSDDASAEITRGCGQYGLYILDVRVPGDVDGIGFAHRLHEHGCKGKIVFVSAYQKPDDLSRSPFAYKWINKPWDLDDLVSIIRGAE
jgi:DNA-binding NtrC family response regulator